MSTPKENERLLTAIPSLTPDTLKAARAAWTKENPMRQIINALADFAIEESRNSLESCEPDQLKALQGQISGIKTLLGKINSQTL